MTTTDFQRWVRSVLSLWRHSPALMESYRSWAEQVRPHDPVLADLYLRAAEASDAIRKHVTERAKG